MNYETLNYELIKSIPELEKAAKKEFDRWKEGEEEEPPQHVFFGYVLNPFLLEKLTTMENPDLLNRVFEFLETMALSGDEDVVGVLTATVLERIGDDKMLLERARPLMGENTLRMSHEVERSWGRE